MTDPITTPAQMREAAALAVANIEIGYHDGIGGDWHPYNGLHIISAACAAIRALPVAEPEPLAVKVRAEALEEAAKLATSFLVGDPKNGVPLRNPTAHEIADAIRALMEKPK